MLRNRPATSAARKNINAPWSRRSSFAPYTRPGNGRQEKESRSAMSTHHVRINVNGEVKEADIESRLLLVHFPRDVLNLTGTHIGCDTTSCGACTVRLNGRAVKSCTVYAVQADGGEVLTVEGLSRNGALHPIQEAFTEKHGLQCGFCTPGMMISAISLLERNPHPTEEEIRWGLSGNLCRCTGYVNIVKAVQQAAEKMSEVAG